MDTISQTDFERRMRGARKVTAEITYRLPDYPSILQLFIWQFYDLYPTFPEVRKFLDHWERNIEGLLYCVRVDNSVLLQEKEIRAAQEVGTFRLN